MPETGIAPTDATELEVGGETVSLRDDELERLRKELSLLATSPALEIAEDVGALRLAGGPILLHPTEAGLQTLRLAIAAIAFADSPPPSPSLLRLSAICELHR
jgi:hypothetical protein